MQRLYSYYFSNYRYRTYVATSILPIQEYRMVDNMLKWAYRAHSEYEKHKFDESETITG